MLAIVHKTEDVWCHEGLELALISVARVDS